MRSVGIGFNDCTSGHREIRGMKLIWLRRPSNSDDDGRINICCADEHFSAVPGVRVLF